MKRFIDSELEAYASAHTKPEPAYLSDLESQTHRTMANPEMLTGRLEGRFLKMLVQIVQPRLVLEVGTFTGYSALSMAEGLSPDGRIMTCELDDKAIHFAQQQFVRSPYAAQIELCPGPALETILSLTQPIDLAFIDADKSGYERYYEEIVPRTRSGGLVVLDNMFLSGSVLAPESKGAHCLHRLNGLIANDDRVENVFLTVRDGVQLVRKK